ncbi:MAG: SLC13 family permease [Peptococcaceae bacterium]|nr:SLC13 family permease [Peptococcaceae bacterium]
MNDQTLLTPEEEACLPKKPPSWRNWIVLAIAAIIFFISTQITIPGLDEKGTLALGYVIAVILLFLFEVFPIAVISILAVVTAAPLGLVPEAEAFANFAVGPGFFVFGVLMIAIAFTSTGFGKRTSLYVSGLLGSKPRNVLLSYMLGTGLISSVLADIPTAFIFGALAVELLKKNGCMPGCSNFGKSIMIGIPIAATVGGLGTPAGGALNVMTISMLQNLCGIEVSFLQWTAICFPFAAIMLIICWFILCKVFPSEIDNVEGLDDIEEQKKELGPMSIAEKKYLFIFAIMLVLWLTSSIHGLSLWLIAVVGAAFLFICQVLISLIGVKWVIK